MTAYPGDQRYFNRYWYAAGNPYKYIDSNGKEIRFPEGAPASFYRNAADAIRYLKEHGQAAGIAWVKMRNEIVNVVPARNRADIYQNQYDANTKTIYWADQAALRMVDPVTGEEGIRTPALILGHEFEHEANHLADPNGFFRDIQTNDSTFKTREESNVITEYENPAARKMGEPIRDVYIEPGNQVRVNCVRKEC